MRKLIKNKTILVIAGLSSGFFSWSMQNIGTDSIKSISLPINNEPIKLESLPVELQIYILKHLFVLAKTKLQQDRWIKRLYKLQLISKHFYIIVNDSVFIKYLLTLLSKSLKIDISHAAIMLNTRGSIEWIKKQIEQNNFELIQLLNDYMLDAIAQRNMKGVEFLLKKFGPSIYSKAESLGLTSVLIFAINYDRTTLNFGLPEKAQTRSNLYRLINSGIELNVKDKEGATFLMMSAQSLNLILPEIVKKLKAVKSANEFIACINIQDKNGMTCLMPVITARNSHDSELRRKKFIRILMENGADPNIFDMLGRTAVSLSAYLPNSCYKAQIINLLKKWSY